MNKIVSCARKYIGVRFRHRGRSERGLDCAGLAWIAYRDAGTELKDFRLYGPEPHDNGLVKHIEAALGSPFAIAPVRESNIMVGDVVVLRFEVEPHHVAIVADYIYGGFSIIHADGHCGRVIETRLTQDMVRRITHIFRKPVN